MKNYQAILGSVISIYLFLGILEGTVQKHVHFAGALNEMACAMVTGMLALLCLVAIDYKKLFNALK